jgi:phage gpG-like protein
MTGCRFDSQALQDAVLGQADSLRDALLIRIHGKLSGAVLHARSGALAASISCSVENSDSETNVALSSVGLPYAAIQEFRGKTAAHDIIAMNAKALAFKEGSRQILRGRVHHPGSLIPPHSYLASSLADMHEEIKSGLKKTILEALGQS